MRASRLLCLPLVLVLELELELLLPVHQQCCCHYFCAHDGCAAARRRVHNMLAPPTVHEMLAVALHAVSARQRSPPPRSGGLR